MLSQGLNQHTGIKRTHRNHKAGSATICQTYEHPTDDIQLGHNNICKLSEHSISGLGFAALRLSLREAHWQMSVAFTRFWLASSISLLPPPACVTSALTSHVTSGRTSEGIPVAGQTSDDFQRGSAFAIQWQKTSFSGRAWPRNETEDRQRVWTDGGRRPVKPAKTTGVHTHHCWRGKV